MPDDDFGTVCTKGLNAETLRALQYFRFRENRFNIRGVYYSLRVFKAFCKTLTFHFFAKTAVFVKKGSIQNGQSSNYASANDSY